MTRPEYAYVHVYTEQVTNKVPKIHGHVNWSPSRIFLFTDKFLSGGQNLRVATKKLLFVLTSFLSHVLCLALLLGDGGALVLGGGLVGGRALLFVYCTALLFIYRTALLFVDRCALRSRRGP